MKKICLSMISFFCFSLYGMDNEPYPTENDFTFESKLTSEDLKEYISKIANRDRMYAYQQRKTRIYNAMHVAKKMGTNDLFGIQEFKKALGETSEELGTICSDHDFACLRLGINYRCVEYLKTINFYNEMSKPKTDEN